MRSAEGQRPLLFLALALLSADALVIGLHAATGGAAAFNLDSEGNVPTWFSSAKLLAIATLALIAHRREREEEPPPSGSWGWYGVGGLFAFLSLDETASLHERTARALVSGGFARNLRVTLFGGDPAKDSFTWVVLFAPLALAAALFLAGFAWTRRERLRRVLALGAAGLACYLLALIVEPVAVLDTPPLAAWSVEETSRYRLAAAVEESAEIFGTTLLLLTAFAYAARGRMPDDRKAR